MTGVLSEEADGLISGMFVESCKRYCRTGAHTHLHTHTHRLGHGRDTETVALAHVS